MADHENIGQALRPVEGGFLQVQLAEKTAHLQHQLETSGRDREAISLIKDYGLNVMLMALRAGARLHEHHNKGPLALQVLSGRVNFIAAGAVNEVRPGSIVALDREIPHSLEAIEDSMVLLTTAIG
jgi:quercetin dioxygenase-like cupin family protein